MRPTLAAIAAAAAIATVASAQVIGWNGSDSFAGTDLNSCNWETVNYGGSTMQQGALLLTTNGEASYSQAGVRSQYMLAGDFDVAVDYEIGNGWNAPIVDDGGFPHIDLTLRVASDNSHAVFLNRTRNRNAEGFSVYTPLAGEESHNQTFRPSSQTRGSLRISRTGASVILFYGDGTSWTTLDTVGGLAEPVFVFLSADNVSARNSFSVRFTDFRMLSGRTSSKPFQRSPAYRSRTDFALGGVVTDYLAGGVWGDRWKRVNPLDVMRQNGFEWVRVGLLTTSSSFLRNTPVALWPPLDWRDEYWSSREYAMEILRQAADRGMRLNVFLYLSDRPAHAGQQFPPPAWANLTPEATAMELEKYAFDTVTDLRQNGLNVEIYDIGNEIDFGILGFRPGERGPAPNGIDFTRDFEWMRANVWTTEAVLLKAASRGVRRADPHARIVLHIAGIAVGDGNSWPLAFFRTMIDEDVDFDYAGFSLPYASIPWKLDQLTTDCWFQRLSDLFDSVAALGKPVIVSEASYPSATPGTVAAAMREFPFTADGQARWLREHLRFLSSNTNVKGFFYFYPDYYFRGGDSTPIDLQYSGLFSSETQPAPAMSEARPNTVKLSASATAQGSSVTFVASVTGPFPVHSLVWELGDGSSSAEANPRHTYAVSGTYAWRVTVTTDAGPVYTTGSIRIGAVKRRAVRR